MTSDPGQGGGRPVATLWQLALDGDRLSCVVYRNRDGLQLRVESPNAVILSEPFEMQPRMLARTQMLRESLKRRGWRELAVLILALVLGIPGVGLAQTFAEVAPDVTTAQTADGLRLDVYAAAYRGTDDTERVFVGLEVRGLLPEPRRGRRLDVTYAFEGRDDIAARSITVPLEETHQRPAPVVRVLERIAGVPPGEHRIRVTVRDSQDGRAVTAVHPIEVPPYGSAPDVIAVTQIMVTSTAVDGFTQAHPDEEYQLQPILARPPSARRTFRRDEKVEVLAEVYEAAPDFDWGGNMTIWTRVRDAEGNIVFDTSDIGASETFTDGRWGYQHWQLVPVRDLAPGNYVLQVGASASDGESQQWRSIPITVVDATP